MDLKNFISRAFDIQGKDLLEGVKDLTPEELAWRPAPHANSVGFLLWHMARVEDGWIQRSIQRKPHLWVSDGWAAKFGMPEEMRDMGFNYSVEQLAEFKTSPLELILGYGQTVRGQTVAFIDEWDPDSETEVRAPWGGTMSVAEVFLQLLWELDEHSGQVAYLRGLQRGLQRPDYMGPMAPG